MDNQTIADGTNADDVIDTSNTSNTGECFVCYDINAPRATCGCSSMFIHTECLMQTVSATNKLRCTVCLRPYTNIEIREKLVHGWRYEWIIITLLFVFSAATLFLSASLIIGAYQYPVARICGFAFFCVGIVSFLYKMRLVRLAVRQNVRCCVEISRVTSVAVVTQR